VICGARAVLLVRRIVVARGAEQDSGELVALIEQLIKRRLELGVAYGQGTISVPLGPLCAACQSSGAGGTVTAGGERGVGPL
jgi:hypothetical protein